MFVHNMGQHGLSQEHASLDRFKSIIGAWIPRTQISLYMKKKNSQHCKCDFYSKLQIVCSLPVYNNDTQGAPNSVLKACEVLNCIRMSGNTPKNNKNS